MTVFDRRPSLRWAVPGVAVAVIAVGALVGSSSVSADGGLEPRTPAQLLVALQQPTTSSFSGTVEVTADLGIPSLPGMAGSGGADPAALVSGTHTLRVWSDGPERSRVALMDGASEYDVIRNGSDMWTWSSSDATVTHAVVDPSKRPGPGDSAAALPRTPQEAAALALEAIQPSTDVTVSGVASVAGRPVYELLLTPRQGDTRVARVAVAVDSETGVPLRVQVFSTVMADPAFEIGFTSVDFARPDPAVFTFTPPPGATVTEHTGPSTDGAGTGATKDADAAPTVVGTGWSSVVVAEVESPETALAALEALPKTSGTWGSGRVLEGTLISVILTDDGRIAAGAVDPKVLGAALTSR